jgi:hypothetical protein
LAASASYQPKYSGDRLITLRHLEEQLKEPSSEERFLRLTEKARRATDESRY